MLAGQSSSVAPARPPRPNDRLSGWLGGAIDLALTHLMPAPQRLDGRFERRVAAGTDGKRGAFSIDSCVWHEARDPEKGLTDAIPTPHNDLPESALR
jgi:hypothetical protein